MIAELTRGSGTHTAKSSPSSDGELKALDAQKRALDAQKKAIEAQETAIKLKSKSNK